MKIAVASEKTMVTGHFGHCENFNIFETENGIITGLISIPNPGHKPGFLPNFLGDMGGSASAIFNQRGIEVITGASGIAREATEKYLKGELKSSGSICHEHQHHGECSH